MLKRPGAGTLGSDAGPILGNLGRAVGLTGTRCSRSAVLHRGGDIGAGAFIGSGTVLCAPAEVADGAMTAAGAVVKPGTHIKDGELWVGVPARYLRQRDAAASKGGEV